MSSKNSATNSIFLRILEHMSYIKLCAKYSANSYTYSNLIINKLIFNNTCKTLAKYKEFLIFNASKEFIYCFYPKNELIPRLKKICEFYEIYSKIFPNYISLHERKYIYKNIRKKQKMIDAVNLINYENNNNSSDKKELKSPLFTKEVNKEIEKENIQNNIDDTLFTQYSNSYYLKNENIIQNKNINKGKKKELEIKPNMYMESFITNNESNISLYNIMDIINGNKIYINDLKLILNDENINNNYITNIINNNNINDMKNNRNKKSEGIKQIIIKGNFSSNNSKRNSMQNTQSNTEKPKALKNNTEENAKAVSKKILKKYNTKPFPTIAELEKSKKIYKNKNIVNYNNNKHQMCKYKIISPRRKNKTTFSKEKLFINNNTTDNNNLNSLAGRETTYNYYLSTKVSQGKQQIEQNNEKTLTKTKTKIFGEKKKGVIFKRKMTINNQIKNIKKYIRYKHISQDLSNNFSNNVNKIKEKICKNLKLDSCSSLIENMKKINNSKFKMASMSSRTTISNNSNRVKSNKIINNMKKLKKPNIANNNIVIQNNNNYDYFLTENNPNLITGTYKNIYDYDECLTNGDKFIEYLRNIVVYQKSDICHTGIESQKNIRKVSNDFQPMTCLNTQENDKKILNTNYSQKITKIKEGNYYKSLITNQKSEKKFKASNKYYSINNQKKYLKYRQYSLTRQNNIKKMSLYKRNNSNFAEKALNSVGSYSKINNYYSNCSIKSDKCVSPNRNFFSSNTTASIRCYSHLGNKSKSKNRKSLKMTKTKTLKNFNKKFIQIPEITTCESSKNMYTQYLGKNKQKRNYRIFKNNNTRNLCLSSYNTDANDTKNNINKNINSTRNSNINKIKNIESYQNKRMSLKTDIKFKSIWEKNKFSSCDFNSTKIVKIKFDNKGLLDKINNIKNKINEGFYRNNMKKLMKKDHSQKACLNKVNDKKNYINSKRIYENKIIYNDNKENISPQFLIKVNKTKYYENIKSQLYQ